MDAAVEAAGDVGGDASEESSEWSSEEVMMAASFMDIFPIPTRTVMRVLGQRKDCRPA